MLSPILSTSFNPRTPCGVRPQPVVDENEEFQVSIHALLAECDNREYVGLTKTNCFNPRTPCGVRLVALGVILTRNPFQSTHSLRSATVSVLSKWVHRWVSIHALLAECDKWLPRCSAMAFRVSIHALLAECDGWAGGDLVVIAGFNPRTPCGVRPIPDDDASGEPVVSIHALLAECDR